MTGERSSGMDGRYAGHVPSEPTTRYWHPHLAGEDRLKSQPEHVENQLTTHDLDALVLAGGESRRVGSPKALMPLGGTTLIRTVIALLHPLFRRVVVVARDNQALASLGIEVLTDARPERGPLVGLARGLAASDAPWCFVVGCDMPFLRPQVIHRMAAHLGGCDILAPQVEGWLQPLHAFYGQGCLPYAEELLDSGVTSLRALFPLCKVRGIAAADFLDIDPELLSLKDVNTMEDYQAAQRLVQRLQQRGVAL